MAKLYFYFRILLSLELFLKIQKIYVNLYYEINTSNRETIYDLGLWLCKFLYIILCNRAAMISTMHSVTLLLYSTLVHVKFTQFLIVWRNKHFQDLSTEPKTLVYYIVARRR